MGRLLVIIALCAATVLGQQANGSLRGQLLDEFGGAIVGATVTIVDAKGAQKTATTNDQGMYSFNGLVPGRYTVRASTPGFAPYENTEVDVVAGRGGQPLNITLSVTIEEQKVTVESDSRALSTDAENNAGAIVLKNSDLEALPDDPDDLAAALQALAGPSAGPNGGQIFIDGFTGNRLPPKSSIREIRINSNPFSAEYDRLGFGRIEILTKPGSDQFRGQASFNFNDDLLNSRNPFATTRPPHQSRQYGGNFGGPIVKKKASFFIDFDKRDIDDEAVINAIDPVTGLSLSDVFPTPSRRTTFGPRVDYQLNANNTLVARYNYTRTTRVAGVGGFNLASQQYVVANTEQSVQLTETAVINKTIVNETRLSFEHDVNNQAAVISAPTINVQDSFVDGGSPVGLLTNTQNEWQLQNNTSFSKGHHALKLGGRLRYIRIEDTSTRNFKGTTTFTSFESYRADRPSQFRITTGEPLATVSQVDFGFYGQDDWKVRPNLTVNVGLRYENQDNISSHYNFAPRIGFAWSPGNSPQPKTVVRGGFGIFYDRIGESLTLNSHRFNGENQKEFIGTDPSVPLTQSPVSIYRLATDIRTPYTTQSVISVERQLPKNTTLALSYINARTVHLLRVRNINTPLPGTYNFLDPSSGVRPLGNGRNIFEYESSGHLNQNQFIVNMTHRFSRSANMNAFYVFAKSNSDTDGVNTNPANPYDLTGEYGRSSQDVRHRFVINGSFRIPWGVSLNPFVVVSSGRPFNITLGRTDLNGDTVYTERPRFATDLTKPTVIITRWGAFDVDRNAAGQIIPRNFGEGPGQLSTNLRVSKTFGFGKEANASARNNRGGQQGQGGQGGAGGPGGGRMGGMIMGGGGGPRGGGGGGERGGGGGGGFGGGGDSGRRYSLTVSLNFQNLLNHANLANPTGNLSSRLFGISNSTSGGFGGFGGGGASAAYNRKIDASVRFSF
jgi:Carboxypeptidase regulatory-like domain/TonB dependent receptor